MGPLLLIEPFAGRLFLAEELGGERQELLGVAAGVELSRYFALRGFYWRGIDRELTEFQPRQGYGGEAQFTFRAPGVFTFLLAGAGHLGLSGDAGGAADALPLDHHALIVGGGLGVALGQRLRVHAAVRDYIVRGEGPEDVDAAERLLHNPLLSIGLTLVLGGERPAARRREERQWERTHRQRLDEDLERAFAERDRFIARLRAPRAPGAEVEAGPDAERMISIPVPRQGEIYIRYGQPGGVRIESEARALPREQPSPRLEDRGLSAAELREVIRAVVQEEVWRARSLSPLPAPARPLTALDPRVEEFEERLLRRIDELIEQRLREREQRPRPVPAPPDR